MNGETRVIIVNRALGIYFAGAERFDYQIALALQKRGVQVELVGGKRLFSPAESFVSGVPVQYLATPFLRDLSQRLGGRLGNAILRLDQFLFALRCACYLKRRTSYGIIQACSLPHLVRLQDKLRVPVILWFPGTPSMKNRPQIRKAAAVIANGDALRNIRRDFRDDVIHVPLGVDIERFQRRQTDLRSMLGIGEAPLVLNVGRLAPVKNIPLLVKAFALLRKTLPAARMILVGTGPSQGEVEACIRSNRLESVVHMAGFVDHDVLIDYYSAADVFALGSTYDNDPNVIYEAMSCSLPIVATRVGGVSMQIQEGINGFLVESGDAEAFARRLADLLINVQLRESMARANRRAAEALSWDASAERILALYQDVEKRFQRSPQCQV